MESPQASRRVSSPEPRSPFKDVTQLRQQLCHLKASFNREQERVRARLRQHQEQLRVYTRALAEKAPESGTSSPGPKKKPGNPKDPATSHGRDPKASSSVGNRLAGRDLARCSSSAATTPTMKPFVSAHDGGIPPCRGGSGGVPRRWPSR
eukprot:RCo019349